MESFPALLVVQILRILVVFGYQAQCMSVLTLTPRGVLQGSIGRGRGEVGKGIRICRQEQDLHHLLASETGMTAVNGARWGQHNAQHNLEGNGGSTQGRAGTNLSFPPGAAYRGHHRPNLHRVLGLHRNAGRRRGRQEIGNGWNGSGHLDGRRLARRGLGGGGDWGDECEKRTLERVLRVVLGQHQPRRIEA